MKKISICFAIVLSILLIGTSKCFAVTASATLTADKTTVKPGETITVKLNASCDDGLSYVGTNIEYDSTLLTLQSKQVAENWINYGTDKLELFVNSTEKITNATVCTLIFKVNDNITVDSVKISTTVIEITDTNNNEYTKPKSEVVVTIEKENSNTIDDNNENNTDDQIEGNNNDAKPEIKDNTVSKDNLPNTGTNIEILSTLVISVIIVIAVIFYKNKKYTY